MEQRLYQMPSINSHSDSAKFYATARRWKSPARYGWQTQLGEPKKIDKAGKPFKSVRQVSHPDAPDGVAYAWRYHNTDVVTWVSDDHAIIVPWASLSTTSFMEALLPSAFNINMTHAMGCLVGLHDAGDPPDTPEYGSVPEPEYEAAMSRWSAYWRSRHGEGTRWHRVSTNEPTILHKVDGLWRVINPMAITVPRVNPKKAALARREFNTAGFSAWLDAIFALNPCRTVRDAQAYALARAGEDGELLAEDMHANSEIGLSFIQDALRNPELWWAILACPHLRPAQRYTRGGRPLSRTYQEEFKDWLSTARKATLTAAYRKHDAVEVTKPTHLIGIDAVNSAHKLHERWDCDYINWPVIGGAKRGEET